MHDETEHARRQRMAELALLADNRSGLESRYGQVWNTKELRERFEVKGFLAPFVMAVDKTTGKKGLLEFQARPRFYFNWQEDQ